MGWLTAGRAVTRSRVRQLLHAMRQADPTPDTAQLALRYRRDGVAGFDIAGPEKGFPARFLESFQLLRRQSAYYTIHAGEADGCQSVWEAVQVCGANRIGHGVAIIADIQQDERGREVLGEFAAYVLNQQIPFEMCPTSNVQTGAVPSISQHPIHRLDRIGFCITVNPDNRLMSATTLTREFALPAEAFDYSLADVSRLTINAARSVFAPYEARKALVQRIAAVG